MARLAEHIARHRLESGRDGDIHFMPFLPADPNGPKAPALGCLQRAVNELGWQRWWVAQLMQDGRCVGHVNLRGASIDATLHRCELSIGIERGYRGRKLGMALMESAINFSRDMPSLAWLDLKVFAHNVRAIRLYESLGFEAYGKVVDVVRIGDEQIDDVLMTLNVE